MNRENVLHKKNKHPKEEKYNQVMRCRDNNSAIQSSAATTTTTTIFIATFH